jgi:RNA polymerase sigma-70 factor (ECF subfamily)
MSTAEFSTLVIAQRSFMKELAMKLTRSLDDAEDLIQDTCLKAIRNQEKFQEGTNIKGWLYTIMKNTFINNYRRKKYQNTFVDETENSYFLDSRQTAKGEGAEGDLNHEYIMQVIDSVDRTYVEAFMMHFNGYKYEEIAEQLDIPLGTVKSRIFLARKKLMSRLAEFRR